MELSDVIKPGDKIDIKITHQVNQEENGGEIAKVYRSLVTDIFSNLELEIAMPTYGGKMILFQADLECDFVFYTKAGMYRCQAVIKNRYKKDNLYLLRILITSKLEKFQRREFFRISYNTSVKFYHLTEETAKLDTTEKLFEAVQKIEYMDAACTGITQDISGGGVRLISDIALERGQFIFLSLRLTNDKYDDTFHLPGQIIAAEQHPDRPEMFIYRVKFLFRDLKEREKIVRFVFEEERRIRRKEIG